MSCLSDEANYNTTKSLGLHWKVEDQPQVLVAEIGRETYYRKLVQNFSKLLLMLSPEKPQLLTSRNNDEHTMAVV